MSSSQAMAEIILADIETRAQGKPGRLPTNPEDAIVRIRALLAHAVQDDNDRAEEKSA